MDGSTVDMSIGWINSGYVNWMDKQFICLMDGSGNADGFKMVQKCDI